MGSCSSKTPSSTEVVPENNVTRNSLKPPNNHLKDQTVVNESQSPTKSGKVEGRKNLPEGPVESSGEHIASFEPLNCPPPIPSDYISRGEDERRILQQIVHLCNDHESRGVLILSGAHGVGKTTLISRLISNNNREKDELAAKLSYPTLVFWVNCHHFGEKFSKENQKSVDAFLAKEAKRYDQHLEVQQFFHPEMLLSHFLKKKKINAGIKFLMKKSEEAPIHKAVPDNEEDEKKRKQVLVIFDDVRSFDLLQRVSQLRLPSLVITCDFDMLMANNFNIDDFSNIFSIKLEKLSAMSDSGISAILVDDNKSQNLVQICKGLPLIASLLKCRLKIDDRFEIDETPTVIERLVDEVAVSPSVAKFLNALLFFGPGEAISSTELDIFCEIPSFEIVEKCVETSVIQTTSSKEIYMHELIHEAILTTAIREFGLQGSRDECLQQILMKIIMEQISTSKDMFLFTAVKQQRFPMCFRAVDVLNAENLALLCRHRSSEQDGISFLHFLYQAWQTTDPASDASKEFCTIIKVLLRKIIRGVEPEIVLETINCKPKDDSPRKNWRSFLNDFFQNAKNLGNDQQNLVDMLKPWKRVYLEEKWQQRILTDESVKNPLLRLILRDDLDSFMTTIRSLNSEGSEQSSALFDEAVLAASRCGRLTFLEFLWQQGRDITLILSEVGETAMLLASKNGHLNIVEFLFEKNPETLSQVTKDRQSPMFLASEGGFADVVKFLFEKDATLVKKTASYFPEGRDEVQSATSNQETPLQAACRNGHLSVVKFLGDKDPDGLLGTDGNQALRRACRGARFGVLKFLVERNSDLADRSSVALSWNADDRELTSVLLAHMSDKRQAQSLLLRKKLS